MQTRTVGDFPLKDKVVLITGGGSGIGLAFVKIAVKASAKILIADRALTDDAKELVESSGGAIVYQKTDVSNWKDLRVCFDTALQHFSTVPDVYVNNAGIFEPPWSNFWSAEEDERYATIDINLSAVIRLTRMAIKALTSNGKQGVVLNVASTGGLAGNYIAPMYCASKFGVVGFTKSLAHLDQLEGVKVVALCPEGVQTPLWVGDKTTLLKQLAQGQILTPEHVAPAMIDMIESSKYPGGDLLEINLRQGDHPTTATPKMYESSSGVPQALSKMIAGNQVPPVYQYAKECIEKDRSGGRWPA